MLFSEALKNNMYLLTEWEGRTGLQFVEISKETCMKDYDKELARRFGSRARLS